MIEHQIVLSIAKPTAARPTPRDTAVLSLAAEKLCDRVMQWAGPEEAVRRSEYLEDLGHVRKGLGAQGRILTWETVTLAAGGEAK